MAIKNTEGAWLDGQGDYIPTRYIQKLDKKKDQIVTRLANRAIVLNKQLEKFKNDALGEITSYMNSAEEFYGIDATTQQGNKTLTDFANSLKVELRIKKSLAFDEKLGFAKALIDECITKWSEGANDKLLLIVEQAFKTDNKGLIDRDRILGLRKLNIKDEAWQKAMRIIGDSLTVVSKKAYVQFQNKASGKWQTTYLDISKV